MDDWVSKAHDTCHHRVYLLSCDEYSDLLTLTGENCGICGTHASTQHNGKLRIDHEHSSGDAAVRGLLCATCNRRMYFHDCGIRELPGADEYIERAWFKAVPARIAGAAAFRAQRAAAQAAFA